VVDSWPALELNEKRRNERLRRFRLSDEEYKADSSFVMADCDEVAYFKLMRLHGQPLLPPLRVRPVYAIMRHKLLVASISCPACGPNTGELDMHGFCQREHTLSLSYIAVDTALG